MKNKSKACIGLLWKEVTTTCRGIRSIGVKNGTLHKVIDIPFHLARLQASPRIMCEILYCFDNCVDTMQHLYLVKSNGTSNKLLYIEGTQE